jgi:hypothetical protein
VRPEFGLPNGKGDPAGAVCLIPVARQTTALFR